MKSGNKKESLFNSGVALVVGGSGGLGRAICQKFGELGSDVVITYNGNKEAAISLSNELEKLGRLSTALQMSLDDPKTINQIVGEIIDKYGSIHSLVYTVGPDIGQPYVNDVSYEEWLKVMSVEPIGFFNIVKATLPYLRISRGSIVSVTSAATMRYAPRDILSAGPKASVNMLTTAIAREEGRYGIRANIVAPGFISAGLGQQLLENVISEKEKIAIEKASALKRIGTAEEVAEVVLFLASKKASLVLSLIHI